MQDIRDCPQPRLPGCHLGLHKFKNGVYKLQQNREGRECFCVHIKQKTKFLRLPLGELHTPSSLRVPVPESIDQNT